MNATLSSTPTYAAPVGELRWVISGEARETLFWSDVRVHAPKASCRLTSPPPLMTHLAPTHGRTPNAEHTSTDCMENGSDSVGPASVDIDENAKDKKGRRVQREPLYTPHCRSGDRSPRAGPVSRWRRFIVQPRLLARSNRAGERDTRTHPAPARKARETAHVSDFPGAGQRPSVDS